MSRLVRSFVLALVAVVAVSAAAAPASAGLLAYRLNGGVFGRHYWMDPNMTNVAYMPVIRNAVSSWNATPTRIYFTETANQCCDSQADWYAKDYGATGWRGVAVQRLSDGSGAVPCVGCAPFTNWDYTELSLNDFYLKSDCCVTRTQNTAAHEFGHSVALSHSSVTSALMYFSISNYDTYGVYTPQQNDDITFASQLQ